MSDRPLDGDAPEAHHDETIFHSSKYPGLASLDAGLLAEAEKRYAATLSGQGVLNFNELRLTSLPNTIGDCTALVGLFCDGNLLKTLPESLGKCTALQSLVCCNNKLTALPDTIGNCTDLLLLWCFANELTSLPNTIGNCTALETLVSFSNKLAALPDTIGNCAKLKGLDCHANRLMTLPESLGDCIQMTKLACSDNQWDPDWLTAQGLSSGQNPTIESLQVLSAHQSAGRVKPARACS